MSGPAAAALALAAAALLGGSPRPRIAPEGRPPRGPSAGRRGLLATVTGAAVLAALALPPSTWLAAGIFGCTAAVRHRRRHRRRRAAAESRALETALDVLAGELRVGAHPVRAFAVAADESRHRGVAAGLGGVCARAHLGADVTTGLREAARSSALPSQWERLAAYWELGGEHGLAIATLMAAAQREIITRHRCSAQAEAGMAGARASATLLACLPVLGVLLGQLIGADPVAFLLGETGGVLSLIGSILVCGGLLWSDRITTQVGGAA